VFHRLTVLFLTALALLMLSSAPAIAEPPGTPSPILPAGFPDDLKKFVGTTPEFRNGPWFTQGRCRVDSGFGGDVFGYLEAVMKEEPRLLYWSTPPDQRKKLWLTYLLLQNPLEPDWSKADPNKEPPILPRTFPRDKNELDLYFKWEIDRPCAIDFRKWADPANNAWGFTWVSQPDAESVRLMKEQESGLVYPPPDNVYTNPCTEDTAPYCQKAYFVDCMRAGSSPYVVNSCRQWNLKVAELFGGIALYIEQNTSWLDKIGEFFSAVGDFLWKAGKIVVDAFVAIAKAVYNIVKFIVNPGDAIDDMANSLHHAAVDFTTKVLQGLASIGNFDPSAPWFLATYAASTGIGLVVMAFMAILMIMRTAAGGGGREDLQQALFKYLPLGVFMAVFAPAIGAVLGEAMNGVTMGIASWDAGYLTAAAGKLALLSAVTSDLIPGGAFIGLLLFLFMIVGGFMVFVGLAMQSIALPMSAVVAGIAWGMWVHPKWRRKALKVPFIYVGVLASKPLLFFLLGVIFALIDGNLNEPAMKAGGIPLLTQIVLVVVALIVSGFAPFSLLTRFRE
jgi:hypothetical protein